jgi:hypothetical protein
MPSKPETAIANALVAWIKSKGGDGYKIIGSASQRGGEPDITGEIYSERLGRWVHLKLEVKTFLGAATLRQTARVQLYQKRGYCAGVVRSVEELVDLLARWEEEHP